jgi:hypothetical protein
VYSNWIRYCSSVLVLVLLLVVVELELEAAP